MTRQEFIFSDKPSHRVSRHLAMWLCIACYVVVVNFFFRTPEEFFSVKTRIQAIQKLIYLPVSILSVYISIYFLLTRFLLKGKYLAYVVIMIFLLLLNVIHAWLLTRLLAMLTQPLPFEQLPVPYRIYQPITNGLGISFATSGLATIIKLFKIDYLKQKENEKLQRQKATTELQRIKSNFHPAFLSDSLKKISYLLRINSPDSPSVILSLSELLSYSLYDNDKEYVLLSQEIQMIKEYLALETKMMAGMLTANIEDSTVKFYDLKIPPLLLLSVVQNICEQTQRNRGYPLELKINIRHEQHMLSFHLYCKGVIYTGENDKHLPDILKTSLPRIQLLYPGKYHLDSYLENNLFNLLLTIETGENPVYSDEQPKTENIYEPA